MREMYADDERRPRVMRGNVTDQCGRRAEDRSYRRWALRVRGARAYLSSERNRYFGCVWHKVRSGSRPSSPIGFMSVATVSRCHVIADRRPQTADRPTALFPFVLLAHAPLPASVSTPNMPMPSKPDNDLAETRQEAATTTPTPTPAPAPAPAQSRPQLGPGPITVPLHSWFTSPARSHPNALHAKELPLHLIQLILTHVRLANHNRQLG
jgi:hypothetical protein